MTSLQLRLERKGQEPGGILADGLVMITPQLGEDYWSYRVCVSEGQAVLGFPKFGVIGCGFAVEDADANRNLPINMQPQEICEHIWINRGDESITRADVVAAVTLIRDAARADDAPGRWED